MKKFNFIKSTFVVFPLLILSGCPDTQECLDKCRPLVFDINNCYCDAFGDPQTRSLQTNSIPNSIGQVLNQRDLSTPKFSSQPTVSRLLIKGANKTKTFKLTKQDNSCMFAPESVEGKVKVGRSQTLIDASSYGMTLHKRLSNGVSLRKNGTRTLITSLSNDLLTKYGCKFSSDVDMSKQKSSAQVNVSCDTGYTCKTTYSE